MAQRQFGEVLLGVNTFDAGAAYFQETGQDIEPNGKESVEGCDAIFFRRNQLAIQPSLGRQRNFPASVAS